MRDRVVFGLGARLGRFAHEVEALSTREVSGWLDYFGQADAAGGGGDGALEVKDMSREQLRAMFPGR